MHHLQEIVDGILREKTPQLMLDHMHAVLLQFGIDRFVLLRFRPSGEYIDKWLFGIKTIRPKSEWLKHSISMRVMCLVIADGPWLISLKRVSSIERAEAVACLDGNSSKSELMAGEPKDSLSLMEEWQKASQAFAAQMTEWQKARRLGRLMLRT